MRIRAKSKRSISLFLSSLKFILNFFLFSLMKKEPIISYEERILQAAKIIKNSNYLVVFTGAGISTESGIPDYRGPDGVWTRRDKGLPPPQMKVPWDQVKPNSGHYALVDLQNLGIMKFLISQNVDNLHLKSGIKEDLIAEFHGNSERMRCLGCDKRFIKSEIWDEKKWGKGYLSGPVYKDQPKCPECGGRIISSIVNFKDPIPDKEYNLSIYHSQKADVFLVVGSSLSVTPVSYMPQYTLKNQAKLIIINREETPLDHKAMLLFHENAGETLVKITNQIKNLYF